MSTKRYCDICGQEIGDTQQYRQYDIGDGIEITVSYSAVKTTYESEIIRVPVINQIDVCFQCIKKEVQNGR